MSNKNETCKKTKVLRSINSTTLVHLVYTIPPMKVEFVFSTPHNIDVNVSRKNIKINWEFREIKKVSGCISRI